MVRSLSVGVALALLLTACSTLGSDNKTSQSLDPLSDPRYSSSGVVNQGALALSGARFDDVPTPMGAKEDLQRSYVYESSSLQIGRMVYNIKAPINEVAQFYIQQCPSYGWQLESVLQAEGAHLLFEKPDRRLTISVTNPGVAKRGVQLIVHLTPKDSSLDRF